MARASSPLSQRLKALAVRAGLPVDTGPAPVSAPPADDEQPTGEFPAVASSDTPDDDRPTGEFPAVPDSASAPQLETHETATDTPAADVDAPEAEVAPETEPAPQAEAEVGAAVADEPAVPSSVDGAPEPETPDAPRVPDPIWGQPSAAVPPPVRDEPLPAPPAPIWTDAPPESQTPQTSETAALDPSVAADAPSVPEGPTLSPPVLSKPAQLDEAMSLDADPESEPTGEPDKSELPTDDAPTTSFLTEVPAPTADEPAAPVPAVDEPAAPASEADDAAPTATSEAAAGDELPPPAKPAKDRLSLTGRFAALRRRTSTPQDAPETDSAGVDRDTPVPSSEDAASPTSEPTPQPIAPNLGPVIVDGHAHKPSFSERAALRRRVKTLRARRDTGLLELGAIVLDQRRFGDPTAGALLRRRTDELGDLDNEIAEIERALDEHASAAAVAALGAVRCVGCSSLVGPTERYCAHCGTPRPVGGTAGDPAADPRS